LPREKITNKAYLFFNLWWDCPPDKNKNPRYRHNTLSALAFMVLETMLLAILSGYFLCL